jgi:hypothetical protein
MPRYSKTLIILHRRQQPTQEEPRAKSQRDPIRRICPPVAGRRRPNGARGRPAHGSQDPKEAIDDDPDEHRIDRQSQDGAD